MSHNYELSVTFSTGRALTDNEITDLLNRLGLEIDEPTTTDADGMPTEAEWSGRNVRMTLIDDNGTEAGTWRW
jgi:hypothetical protein